MMQMTSIDRPTDRYCFDKPKMLTPTITNSEKNANNNNDDDNNISINCLFVWTDEKK